jgi:hypothetical protein
MQFSHTNYGSGSVPDLPSATPSARTGQMRTAVLADVPEAAWAQLAYVWTLD